MTSPLAVRGQSANTSTKMFSLESFVAGMIFAGLFLFIKSHMWPRRRITWLGARVRPQDQERLADSLLTHFAVPRKVQPDYHCTIMYSRHCPGVYCVPDYNEPVVAKFVRADMLGHPERTNLVLVFECEYLKRRHAEEMRQKGATYDFPEYVIHVTVQSRCRPNEYKEAGQLAAIEKMIRSSALLSAIRFTGESVEHFDE